MSILILGVAFSIALAIVAVPLISRSPSVAQSKHLRSTRLSLLSIAAAVACWLSLVALATAAWGMNTSLPWGLGYFMYLTPVLSMPAFLLLKFGTVRLLSRVFWLLTVTSSFAFYFGDQADRLASGLHQAGTMERLGTAANGLTLGLLSIAVLVQTASACATKEVALTRSAD